MSMPHSAQQRDDHQARHADTHPADHRLVQCHEPRADHRIVEAITQGVPPAPGGVEGITLVTIGWQGEASMHSFEPVRTFLTVAAKA
eukprot:2287835-Prymnesium_polylepis.3